jgi:methionyl-tRNA formyltransferase
VRVVMFGYQTWGHRTLRALLESDHDVPLVVTHPPSDHPYERIWADSVADLAAEHGVPVLIRARPDDDELVTRLKEADPDVIVATNWRTWIPPRIFDLPPYGTLNVHDSLLPAYAGFAPLLWALINGESEVGVTAHVMTEQLDAGAIVLQRAVPVDPTDTTTDLFHKTIALFGPVTIDGLALLAAGRGGWVAQDSTQASFFHKRSIEDSRVDWTWPAEDLERLVRAQSDPYPNAFTFHRGNRIRILAAAVTRRRYGGTPGRIVLAEDDGVAVVAGPDARRGHNRALLVQRIRTDDGTEHAATDYFRPLTGYLTSHP